jgi:hypothetical protein
MRYFILTLILSGCGIHVTSDPIIVTHKLDLSAIAPYCKDKCAADINVQICTDKCITDFLAALGGITAP